MLNIFHEIPKGFLKASPAELYHVLPGPSLIHLPGKIPEPLFISTLLHGNEWTGLLAVQDLLKEHAGKLPRAVSIFIGNVAAARVGHRSLPGQPDYNRIWQSTDKTPEAAMMGQILSEMQERKVFASVDIHNNTGVNPHYACINQLDPRFYHLAQLFSRTVVYFRYPTGVQSMAFANLCPAVTLECGQVGDASGEVHAKNFLEQCLQLESVDSTPLAPQEYRLFHTVAVIKVPFEVEISFGSGEGDIDFREDLDHLNFRELPVQTLLGTYQEARRPYLRVINEKENEVGERYLLWEQGQLRTRCAFMPSMFTKNVEVIRQDCLGYLMEPMTLGL